VPNSDARPSLKHLFLLSIVLLLSAPTEAAESLVRVEGAVQDPYGTAVVGAQVTCKKSGARKDEFLKTVSDYSGAFTFDLTEPGSYNIDATADGYVEPNAILEGYRGLVRVAKVQEGGKPTVRRVRLLLYKEAVVRGRLVEVENDVKKPVVKQTVGMVVTRFYEGQLTLSSLVASAVTDSKGAFVIEKLPPGDYYVQVAPTANEAAKAGTAEKPVKVAERPRVYRRTYWPENAASVYGRPFRVDSGADVNVGDILIRKGPFFRISGTVEFSNCREGEKYALMLTQEFGQSHQGRAAISLPCQTPFVIENVSPGSYQLLAWIQGRPVLDRQNALTDMMVQDRDVELALQARQPQRLSGKVEFPENFPREQRAEMRVMFKPTGRTPFDGEGTPVPVEKEGSFVWTATQLDEIEIRVQGLQPPFFVRKITYNGSPAAGPIVALDPHGIDHHIQIAVSDRPGTVEGLVTVSGKAAPGMRVLVSRWPFVFKRGYPVFETCRVDEEGRYRQTGLAPGVYRLAAIGDSALRRIHRREDAMEILSAGKEVEIAEGTTRSLDLEVSAW